MGSLPLAPLGKSTPFMNKYTHRGRLKSPLNLFPGVHILFTFHCSLGLTFCHGPSIFSRHIQRGAPERVGMEIECAAASKKTRTDRKGKQGHGNNRNLGLIFHEACLLPPAPEGVLCWGKKKKRLPFPRGVWKGNLYAWWVKFPFEKFLPPPIPQFSAD